jgi:hypothetical protein
MPTSEQLANPRVATDGNGSNSIENEDGSATTTWPDGTVRVDYPDQSFTITFTDGAVLNVYADGSRTLNDQFGNPLDPGTGQALETPTPPLSGPDRALQLLNGEEPIADVMQAQELLDTLREALEGEISPAGWATKIVEAILEVAKALETEERGCEVRGWCYAVLYGALDMGVPPEPTFAGSLQGPEQDQLNLEYWREGVMTAQNQLQAGTDGVALRNRLLLRVAVDGGDPARTVTTLWLAACAKTADKELADAYPALSWPQPIGA